MSEAALRGGPHDGWVVRNSRNDVFSDRISVTKNNSGPAVYVKTDDTNDDGVYIYTFEGEIDE